MSVMIPILDTQQNLHNNNNDDLWNIIQEQRIIIQELQKALNEVSFERDELLTKVKNSSTFSSNSSTSSSTEDIPSPPQQLLQQMNTTLINKSNNKLPIPPPRSPYRSNTDTQKTLLLKKKNKKFRHSSSLPNLNQEDLKEEHHVEEELLNFEINVKSIHTSSLILSVFDKKNKKELWKIEKSFTDLLSLDITVSFFLQAINKYILFNICFNKI
jgi:hypothetical protein